MAITVSHQPSFGLLAAAGYQAGAGQFHAQQQQMASRERMQERALQANFIGQQMQMAGRFGMQQAGHQMDMQRQQAMFEQQDNLQRLRAGDMMDRMKEQNRFVRDQRELANMGVMERDQAQFFNGQLDQKMDMVNELEQAGYEYADPTAKERWAKEMERINNDQTLRPDQKAQARFQLSQSMPIPEAPPAPPISEQWEAENHFATDPDTGQRILASKDRNGAWRNDILDQPEDEGPTTLHDKFMKDDKAFTNIMTSMSKLVIDAQKAKIDAYKLKAQAHAQKQAEQSAQGEEGEGGTTTPKAPVGPAPEVPEVDLDLSSMVEEIGKMLKSLDQVDEEQSIVNWDKPQAASPQGWQADPVVN